MRKNIEQRPTFTSTAAIQAKDLEQLQQHFKGRLEILRGGKGELCIKPESRDLDRFRHILLATGAGVLFEEFNLGREHV